MSQIKHRPVIFSAESIRAILAGRKTQTRRIAKPQPSAAGDNGGSIREIVPSLLLNCGDLFDVRYELDNPKAIRCPFGRAGDRLWVREAWAIVEPKSPLWDGPKRGVIYKATPLVGPGVDPRWRSPIHMPHWASRLTLEIVEVRVERLQSISAYDCIAEGLQAPPGWTGAHAYITDCLRKAYAEAWDRLNGKCAPWASNPWIWVVSVRRCEP